MPTFGVYKAVDGYTAGDEVSSTYEGRHVTVLESDLVHPTHADGFVDKGDPVVFGATGLQSVGVAFKSAAAAADSIAIDTEGIWGLSVVGSDDSGNSAVAGGDLLYINITTAVVSKISSSTTNIPFGYALGIVGAGATGVIAVKVHFDPAVPTTFQGAKTFSGAVTLGAALTVNSEFVKGQRFTVTMQSFAAADVAKGIWIAPAGCSVIEALEAHGTVAGQAGVLNVEKCTTGEAAAAGDVVLATGWDLTAVINTPVTLAALATGVEDLIDGDELRLKLTSGAATSLVDAVVTVVLEWT